MRGGANFHRGRCWVGCVARAVTAAAVRCWTTSFDLAPRVRAIVLDVIRRDVGSGGVVHAGQARWLAQRLQAAGSRWVIVFSHAPLERVAGGARLLALLDRDPHVVAATAGDTHRNSIAPRGTHGRGYWLVTTSSLVDYPQQVRMFRLRETAQDV